MQYVEFLVGRSRKGDKDIGVLHHRAVHVVGSDDHLGTHIPATGLGAVAFQHGHAVALVDGA